MAFQHEYQNKDVPIALQDISWIREKGSTVADATLAIHNELYYLSARGNGPLDAVSNVLKIANPNIQYQFVDYEEHALETDSDSLASAYVVIADEEGNHYWGGGCRQRHHHGLGLRPHHRREPGKQGEAIHPHP